jgi:hypothetical protein
VLLIACGLLSPRTAAYGGEQPFARPVLAGDVPYGVPGPFNYPASAASPAFPQYPQYQAYAPAPSPVVAPVQPVRTASVAAAPRRQAARVVAREPKRDWKKTALVIGGSTAAGAGLGGIFGGKKGALIGAAIGGGASTIYETTKN